MKTAFVSGCFDLLHSGHVAFLRTAAEHGTLHVGVARDATVAQLKGRAPQNPEHERLFMVRNIGCVARAFISSGVGMLDFEADLRALKPDVFIVNHDGNTPEKAALCAELGTQYIVLPRVPAPGLPERNSTSLRAQHLPWRVELAGAWLDQPFISTLHPGSVICLSIEPTHDFMLRSGMAGSTRNRLAELFGNALPNLSPEQLAKLTFRYENGIDLARRDISGAQDAIGLCVPGITRQHYTGGYWPEQIERITDEDTLAWLEQHVALYPTFERPQGYDPTAGMQPTAERAAALAQAADMAWQAILAKDAALLGESLNANRLAQQAMLPAMFPLGLQVDLPAWKFTGAGGGGYLVTTDTRHTNIIPIKIRR
ncbi:MAG: adenylyltransferase/cytidyltransferase family protein [Oscillospiraceae bacterium]|nr:adenylyltransferase/cytidyltransferase family protein [Oscillospiraceae bacterium]